MMDRDRDEIVKIKQFAGAPEWEAHTLERYVLQARKLCSKRRNIGFECDRTSLDDKLGFLKNFT